MPSLSHEAPLAVLQEKPELVLTLLEKGLHVHIPTLDEVRTAPTTLSQPSPVYANADLVVLGGDRGKVELVVIFETQLREDRDKLFVWPLYGATAHYQYRCETLLVVFAPEERVANWAERPIQSLQQGGFTPLVLRASHVPKIAAEKEARKNPELAAFSAVVHGRDLDGIPISQAAWLGLESLPESKRQSLRDLIYLTARPKARQWMELLMDPQLREKLIKDFQKHLFEEGKEEGRQEAAEAMGRAIVRILEKRELALTEEQKQTILSCRELETLERWLDRALSASSPRDVFDS